MSAVDRASLLQSAVGLLNVRAGFQKFFLRNACARHGIPYTGMEGEETPVEMSGGTQQVSHEHRHKFEADAMPSPAVTPFPQKEEKDSSKGWLTTAALIVAALLIGGGAGSLPFLFMGDDEQQQSTQPKEPVDTPVPRDGSLLQELEDRGYHVPEGING